jgi:biotin-(acetyl-CoA carboxylase) ligase
MSLNYKLLFFDSLHSTHEYARLHADQFAPDTLTCVRTHLQSNGIGQQGRSWISLPGNLFVTYIVSIPASTYPDAANFLSLCLYKTISTMNKSLLFKEPNDLYLEGQKCAGVLCHQQGDRLILSYGLNTEVAPPGFSALHLNTEELFPKIDHTIRTLLPYFLTSKFESFLKEWQSVPRLPN